MNQNISNNKINYKTIFQMTWVIYKREYQTFITVGLIYGFAYVFNLMLLSALQGKNSGIAFFINVLITSWASLSVIYTTAKAYKGESLSLYEAIVMSPRKKYLEFISVTSMFFLVCFIGLLMLIAPGIYLGTIFVFVDVLVVLENKKMADTFQRSAELVRGYFWPVLLFSLLASLFYIIPTYLFGTLKIGSLDIGKTLSVLIVVCTVPFIKCSKVVLYYWFMSKETT